MIKKPGKYDLIAPIYDKIDSYYEKNIYSKMRAKYITRIANSSILEIGVGSGKNLKYYHELNDEIIAIDKSLGMLRQASKKLNTLDPVMKKKIKLKKGSVNKNHKKNNFSHIIATFVLCTNNDPTELIHQIYDVLDTDGELILFEWMPLRNGIRWVSLRVINPLLQYLLGVSVYRKPSLKYFSKKRWKLIKKEFFDEENVVLILKKKVI